MDRASYRGAMAHLKRKSVLLTIRAMSNEANSLRTPDGTLILLKTDQIAKWLVLVFAIVSSIIGVIGILASLTFVAVSF